MLITSSKHWKNANYDFMLLMYNMYLILFIVHFSFIAQFPLTTIDVLPLKCIKEENRSFCECVLNICSSCLCFNQWKVRFFICKLKTFKIFCAHIFITGFWKYLYNAFYWNRCMTKQEWRKIWMFLGLINNNMRRFLVPISQNKQNMFYMKL